MRSSLRSRKGGIASAVEWRSDSNTNSSRIAEMVGFLGNSKLISQVNLRLMLQSVRMLQPTYGSAVARHTRLSISTVYCGINALLAKQVVEETDAPPPDWKRNSKGGRPSRMLRVNARARQVLAIDLEPDCLRVALTDMLANPIAV